MEEKIRILCVDDEKNVLRAIERLFLDSEYEILTATSGDEGLEILKKTKPIQLVISDYRMPKMNGVDFLKEVCKLRPETVRIVLSGYADTAAIVEAINEGQIYKFMPKPWNDDELKVAISNAIEHYFMQQKNIQLTRELEEKNRQLQEINNNLERLVEERTSDLRMQNKILIAAQNILDSLPVAVIGIDPEGTVVQCNRKGSDLFSPAAGDIIIGMDRKDSFPAQINDLIERVIEKGTLTEYVSYNGSSMKVKGVYMRYAGGQEGIILVFDEGI
jgi:two-component system NtrC family sensor kinase